MTEPVVRRPWYRNPFNYIFWGAMAAIDVIGIWLEDWPWWLWVPISFVVGLLVGMAERAHKMARKK